MSPHAHLGRHLITGLFMFLEPATHEPLCCFSSLGRGGGCPVRQCGWLEESQRRPEPHQPNCCGQAWPSTSAVQGKIKPVLVLCPAENRITRGLVHDSLSTVHDFCSRKNRIRHYVILYATFSFVLCFMSCLCFLTSTSLHVGFKSWFCLLWDICCGAYGI